MPLYYVTGISGSGKSAVRSELRVRGYDACGTDEDGIAFFINNETGEAIRNDLTVEDRTFEWREKHTWKASRDEVEKLHEQAKDEAVFLCGVVANENEIWDLFEQVFALVIDEETLKRRIQNRTENDFGKSDHEMASILEWQKSAREDYEKFGANIIDATRPVDEVVDAIIKQIKTR